MAYHPNPNDDPYRYSAYSQPPQGPYSHTPPPPPPQHPSSPPLQQPQGGYYTPPPNPPQSHYQPQDPYSPTHQHQSMHHDPYSNDPYAQQQPQQQAGGHPPRQYSVYDYDYVPHQPHSPPAIPQGSGGFNPYVSAASQTPIPTPTPAAGRVNYAPSPIPLPVTTPSDDHNPGGYNYYNTHDEDDDGTRLLNNHSNSQVGMRESGYEMVSHPPHGDYDGYGRAIDPDQPLHLPGGYQGSTGEPDSEENNIRYGKIPQRVPRRYKTIKKVELFHGNYIYDAAVPSKLLNMCANRTEREFTHLRYTGATCDPNDFKSSGFTLRQTLYDPPRRTELFIVMTMYNEDADLFTRTMTGVIKNIQHLCTRDRSKTWGKDGWKKVVVCIVSDGRTKINGRTLSVLAAMGCYQDGVATNAVNGREVQAHIYEYTTQVNVNTQLRITGSEKGQPPIQVLFCLKEKNAKKINSHRWFFNAFGPILLPNVCVLLDVGTQPGPTSIYHLWKAFDINSNVGGACGEIVALKGKYGLALLNPLVAAQNFEYKMSNILDKPLESVFGYITVLPGAFSAYRYYALQNDEKGEGPLQKYFLGEKLHGADADIFTANMYLAEDRILCWELVSKRGGSWVLHYVKSAYAVTDVPDQVPELISQRRRWLNGSFFAAIHSTVHFKYIYRSSHSFARKFWIHVELFYQVYNLIFSWFALGNYYIAFVILTRGLEDELKQTKIPNLILQYVYLGLLTMCFLLALGNRPQGSKWAFTGAMIGFGFITTYMTFAAFYLAVRGAQVIANDQKDGTLTFSDIFTEPKFGQIILSIAATVGLYLVASLLFFEPWHMITSFFQYLLLAPSYISVLNVYAFANVHDISWGTKGDNKISTDLGVVATTDKKDGKETADVTVPTDQRQIDAAYDDALAVLSTKAPPPKQTVDEKTKQEDYYKSFRTRVLLVWTLSNGLLAAVITSTLKDTSSSSVGASAAAIYVAFILYSVAGLAFFRFIGSTAYMLIRLFAGE